VIKKRLAVLGQVFQNPVAVKELRGRMRGGRAFVLITAYLILLGGMVSLIYLLIASSSNTPGGPDPRQSLGKAIFSTVVLMELLLVCFIAPALTAGSISLERERQTFELLRTTLLPARTLVMGKLISAFAFLLLLLFAAFPLQSLAALFGGVAIEEIVISSVLLLVTAFAFCAIGLFFSSIVKRTLASTVLAYTFTLLSVFGIPILILITVSFISSVFFNGINQLGPSAEVWLIFLGWLIVSSNPLAAAISSEVLLLEQQATIYTALPLTNGRPFPIISPWIGYCVFYLMLGLVLIVLSIRFVRRVEN
jgi:ABC-2 type transport system permease protein